MYVFVLSSICVDVNLKCTMFNDVWFTFPFFFLHSYQPQFLNQLSEILVNPNNGQVARIAAGLQLKNALTSKDPNVNLQHQHRWLGLALDIRNNIKRQVKLTYSI